MNPTEKRYHRHEDVRKQAMDTSDWEMVVSDEENGYR